MKIVIDARFWGTPGGFGRYLQEIISRIGTFDRANQYYIIVRRTAGLPLLDKNVHHIVANVPWYGWREQIVIPLILWRLKPDLVHFPHFNLPWFYRGKFVVTIHDLILFRYPSAKASLLPSLLFRWKYWVYRQLLARAIQWSQFIITPSQFTKDDIISWSRVAADKIRVIPEASSMSVVQSRDQADRLLYVGNCYPHKNVDLLLQAFRTLAEGNSALRLHLVIPDDYFSQHTLTVTDSWPQDIKQRLVVLHSITDEQLKQEYQNSTVYIFPSRYEGFGLPGLEAMSCGLPVIASRVSCLPEVYGEAAYYFTDNNCADLQAAITKLLQSFELRADLRQRGYQQLQRYSWDQATMQTIDLYLKG